MRLLAATVLGLVLFYSNLVPYVSADPHTPPKYFPAFLDAKKDFEKGVMPAETVLLTTWKCTNYRPVKEAAPVSELRFLKQEGELRMTMTLTNTDGEVSFENDGPFVLGLQGWSAVLSEETGLRASIKMDPTRKHLVIETAGDLRAKDVDGFQQEFKAVSDPKMWVMTYSVCSLEEN